MARNTVKLCYNVAESIQNGLLRRMNGTFITKSTSRIMRSNSFEHIFCGGF